MQITNDVACLYANMTLKTDDEDDPFWCLTLEPPPEAGKDSRAFLVPDLEEQERDNLVSRDRLFVPQTFSGIAMTTEGDTGRGGSLDGLCGSYDANQDTLTLTVCESAAGAAEHGVFAAVGLETWEASLLLCARLSDVRPRLLRDRTSTTQITPVMVDAATMRAPETPFRRGWEGDDETTSAPPTCAPREKRARIPNARHFKGESADDSNGE